MANISKSPGVKQLLPLNPVKPVVNKKMNDKKDNKNDSQNSKNDEDEDKRHIDEYA